jgi:hypothetical protein
MSKASTNQTSLSYIEEVTPGVTPASPQFQILPTTGGAPSGKITTTTSQVIRRDRQIDDLVPTDSEVGGEIKYELAYGPFKPLIAALLEGPTVVVDIAGTDLFVTGPDTFGSTTTDFDVEEVVVGMNIRVMGFTTAANNGIFKVLSVAPNEIVVDASTLVSEIAGDSVTIDAECVRNGAETPKSYTFLKFVEGITTPAYFYYTGCQVSKMNFDFQTGAILAGSLELVGLEEIPTTTAKAGQGLVDVASYSLLNSVSSITKIDIQGLPVDTSFSSLNLTVDNGITRAKAIGVLGAVDVAAFTLNVTAAIALYFNDLSTYQLYVNAQAFSIAFTLEDNDGNIMVVSLPKCKFEELDAPIDGKDSFLMLNGSLRALRDDVTNSTIQVDFFDAP